VSDPERSEGEGEPAAEIPSEARDLSYDHEGVGLAGRLMAVEALSGPIRQLRFAAQGRL